MTQLRPELLSDFTGGLNRRGAPLKLSARDLILLENMYPVADGYLVGRGGQTEYNSAQIDSNPIRSLYRFYKQAGTSLLLATSGTKVYKGNDGAGTFSEIDSGYTSDKKFSFVTWSSKDKAYWINGVQVLKSYDGTTVATVGGSPPVGSMVELHKDRLWILQPSLVSFSDLNVDNVWPGASALNIADNQGGIGQFIKSANQVLIVAKTSGLWRFEGSPLLGGELRQYSNIGCIAPWSADVVTADVSGETIPVAVIYLSSQGLYLTDGFSVIRMSDKIDPIFTDYFRGAVGKYYPKRQQFFFSFNAAGGANDTLYVATRVNTPAGSVVAWSQYNGFKAESFAVLDGAGDKGELYSGRSDGGKVRKLDVGAQDVGVDFTAKFTTHFLDFKDPTVNKQVRWLKAIFEASKPVNYLINYFDLAQLAGGVTVAGQSGLQWDVNNWDVGAWGGQAVTDERISLLSFLRSGRFVSLQFSNAGDGPGFKMYQLEAEARIKDRRSYNLFTLNQTP
jgi:hypothetical protein